MRFPSFTRCARASGLWLLAIVLTLFAQAAKAETVPVKESPSGLLGTYADYLMEESQPLGLEQAIAQFRSGKAQRSQQPVLDFGIGSRPVWVHLEVSNATSAPLEQYLVGGATWIDRLDAYVVQSGKQHDEVHTGDELRYSPGLAPALGYAMPLYLPPGSSDIYLRVDSVDPLVLPLELMSREQFEKGRLNQGYYYGLFYGFLAALIVYSLLLFAGIRERSYFFYSLTLLFGILCNLAYTGHGMAWLWPQLAWPQRYALPVLMVLYGIFSLLFASRFLLLAEYAPHINRVVKWSAGAGLGVVALFVLTGSHLQADLLAFVFLGLSSIGVLLLGIWSIYRGRTVSGYFLAGAIFGLLGVAGSDFAVWGKVSFISTSNAMEVGLVIEATLLALALSYTMRLSQRGAQETNQVARQDPLTGLNNRRAFMDLASPCWSSAERSERPLSLIIMDIDHFKQINDQYGHKVGDEVLEAVADLLRKYGRTSDISARWGGEEFILLLTETSGKQAATYAERLRQAITELQVFSGDQRIMLTASFGVVQRNPKSTLEGMVELADVQLHKAKADGRNRVCCSDMGQLAIAAA